MTTLLLIRHGRTTANASHLLAGRAPGVHLDSTGRDEVRRARQRLTGLDVAAVYSSPLERCRETAAELGWEPMVVEDLTECDYGDWTGQPLADLTSHPLWPTIQNHPSAVTFPGGESLCDIWSRAVRTVRGLAADVAATRGTQATWAVVSHGDIIKAICADALGMHLDAFQRIVVDPASVSVISYQLDRTCVLSLNTTAGPLSRFADAPSVAVGGGLGSQESATT